ncbi:ATP-binding protein, partial [Actinocorallia lasiicapitis]
MVEIAPPSGRALAAIVFTDMVGSTATRSALGEEAGNTLRRAHDKIVTSEVKEHGGIVVKGLGDGMMAVFSGASEAVEAAIGVQRGVNLQTLRGALPAALVLRIGISVGEVVWEDGDCFGTPVIEASRLCNAADGGQILAAELVRVLTGGRLGSLYSAIGGLTLKGLAKPLETVEVAWRHSAGDTSVALPAGLRPQGALPLTGRSEERSLLLREWRLATSGDRREEGAVRAVLVSGEPGVGKTRVIREVAGEVHETGAVVLHGQCDEAMCLPYHPLVTALGEFAAATPDDVLRSVMGPLSGELVRLLPSLRDRVPELAEPLKVEPATERYRLFEAVVDLFAAISQFAPVLLVLDDLHWADSQTLLLLSHLARAKEPMRLLVLGAFRDTDIGRDHQLTHLLPDLRRAGRGRRLALGRLDADSVTDLVSAALDRPVDDDEKAFARHLHAETDGHPFCVEEVLLHLRETGRLASLSGRWAPGARAGFELTIPEGVREVVLQRLARLDDDVQEVLRAASVIGQQFDVGVLASVVDGGMASVVAALEAAETAQLVGPVIGGANRFRFAHTLIRSSVYEDMPTTRRRWMHRDVGLALEDHEGTEEPLAELAVHFGEAAAVGETERAIGYARRAGDRAMEQSAYELAAAHYARALNALQLGARRSRSLTDLCDLRLARAKALYRAGDDAYRETAFRAADTARTLDDADRLARTALLLIHFGPANPLADGAEIALFEEALAKLST